MISILNNEIQMTNKYVKYSSFPSKHGNYRQNINDISLIDYQLNILAMMPPNTGYEIYSHILLGGVQKQCHYE